MKKDKDNYYNLKELVNLLNEQLKQQRLEFKQEIKKKDNQINELMKKVGVNIGTQNNINNIQNNMNILDFYNKSDISHFKDQDYIGFLKHSNFCIPHMIKKIHFDKKKPENHNIYISNLKNNYVMIYNGDRWTIQDRNEIIDNMIDDNTNILEDKIERWIEKENIFIPK